MDSHSVICLIQSVGKSCSSRLVDDSQYIQSRYLPRILRGLHHVHTEVKGQKMAGKAFSKQLPDLSLRVIEVGRDCDDSILYRLSQISLCIHHRSGGSVDKWERRGYGGLTSRLFHLHEDEGPDLAGGVDLAVVGRLDPRVAIGGSNYLIGYCLSTTQRQREGKK